MNKFLLLALAGGLAAAGGAAGAQTPATNPMPDGSRDMYAGLGVQSAPRYEGAGSRKVSALPVLQIQWSSGLFISGMTAGMHLADSPTVEYGPLLAVHPGRDESGSGRVVDGTGINGMIGMPAGSIITTRRTGLGGMDEIGARLEAGAFYNVYLNPQWRATSSLLYGAGHERKGARLELGVQRLAATLGERHRVSLAAGLSVVNGNYNQSYFGVTAAESARSGFAAYRPGAGLQDAHLGLRWNWVWSPSWMLSTNLAASRLLGNAAKSPLVERSTNLTVSSAVAYRF